MSSSRHRREELNCKTGHDNLLDRYRTARWDRVVVVGQKQQSHNEREKRKYSKTEQHQPLRTKRMTRWHETRDIHRNGYIGFRRLIPVAQIRLPRPHAMIQM